MDSEEIRAILSRSRVGVWELIEAAVRVAGSDYGEELRRRRDGIVESLYAPAGQLCPNCGGGDDVDQDDRFYNRSNNINNTESDDIDKKDSNHHRNKKFSIDDDDDYKSNRKLNESFSKSPLTPESNHRNFSGGEEEEEDVDPYGGLFDDEQTQILSIKEQLEDPQQNEDAIVELLQNLADMDITFQALEDTDIGRHVNRLRKHPSEEVRRLVKQLVRKWKETVDEWVEVNPSQANSNLVADVDSPQQNIPKNQQNGHHQVPDFGYSPNPRTGSLSAERNYADYEAKPKPPQSAARREAPSRPPQSVPKSVSAPNVPDFGYSPNPRTGSSIAERNYADYEAKPKPPQSAARREAPSRPPQSVPKSVSAPNRAPKEPVVDDERLNSARKRLQENYQEAQNAKKQRTIQVMDIHEIPKPKNGFFARNKGGFQGRHHR